MWERYCNIPLTIYLDYDRKIPQEMVYLIFTFNALEIKRMDRIWKCTFKRLSEPWKKYEIVSSSFLHSRTWFEEVRSHIHFPVGCTSKYSKKKIFINLILQCMQNSFPCLPYSKNDFVQCWKCCNFPKK